MQHRRRIIIEPGFQFRFITRLAAWVAFATLVTGLVTWIALSYQDGLIVGDYFYILPEGGAPPKIMSHSAIILPTVLLSLIVNLTLSILFALFYSRRLAGPVHKLRLAIERLTKGEKVQTPFRLRKQDEFHDLATTFNDFLQKQYRDQ